MDKLLVLLGLRTPAEGKVYRLFQSWHTIVVIAVAAGVSILMHKLG